jgi:hypothetical protein
VTVEAAAYRSRIGRRWLAYWWLRGIRPKPADVTMEQLDAMLDGADLECMDYQVAEGRRQILGAMR